MDPGNIREALREAQLDEAEGADILMVKPATLYLDVMAAMRKQVTLPIAAYHVSGVVPDDQVRRSFRLAG